MHAFFAVIFYTVVSLGVTLFNKGLFNLLNAPAFITWFQMVATVFTSALCGFLGQRYFRSQDFLHVRVPAFSMVPPFQFKPAVAVKVAPLSLFFMLMITFTNMTLSASDFGFYQVAHFFKFSDFRLFVLSSFLSMLF
jgi:solute carrier family 35 (GDP-fucose transporter), member C1